MKHLRPIIILALFTFSTISIVLYTGCSKSKCGGTTCQNGSTCTGDKCVCPTGYSGTSCEKGWSDASIGTYTCTRSGCIPAVADTTSWQSSVTKSGSNGGYTINIANFDKSGKTVVATIDSFNQIRIAPTAGSFGINASGAYAAGVINLHYTTSSSGGTSYSCYMTMVKQ